MDETTEERALPLLGGIAALLRWLEELANLIAGPLLTLGLGIALVDLLTDGRLLATWALLLYAWAISQAVGVDAQLVATWDRAKRALLARRWWALCGQIVLGLALAYVAYVAGWVFAVQESNGLTETQALSALHMDAQTWLWQRVGVSVFLVCLSGWTRYRAPRQRPAVADERAALEAQLTLEPLRAELRARRAGGYRAAAAALWSGSGTTSHGAAAAAAERATVAALALPGGDAPESADQPEDAPPPPPPDRPTGRSRRATRPSSAIAGAPVSPRSGRERLRVVPSGQTGRALKAGKRSESGKATRATALRGAAFALLDKSPGLTRTQLRDQLGCRQTTATALWQDWRYSRAQDSQPLTLESVGSASRA